MQIFWRDLRYGARMLFKTPGFTLVTVLTLALGIGATTAIFSVVDAIVWRPLPFAQPDRLVSLHTDLPEGFTINSMQTESWLEWRTHAEVFQAEAYDHKNFIVSGGAEPEAIAAVQVTPGLLPMLGVRPMLGRMLEAGDDRAAVISYKLWQNHFNGAPDIVGKTLTLDQQPWTVVGVMPREFSFPRRRNQLWVPMAANPTTEAELHKRVEVVARLRDGLSFPAAQAQLQTLIKRLDQEKPRRDGWAASLHPLDRSRINPGPRRAMMLLFGAVCFVLLIACANAANLLLARGAAREKELAVRAALGAGRFRLMQQSMVESLLLSLLGGGAGVLFALWGVDLIARTAPQELTFLMLNEMAVNGRALAFTAGLSVLTTLLCGLAPALRGTRLDLLPLLKGAARVATADPRQHRLRRALVVVEVALSVILLVGAGLLIRSFARLSQVPPGYDPKNLLALTLSLTSPRYAEPAARKAFFDQLQQRLVALPGVTEVTRAGGIPPKGAGFSFGVELEVEGRGKQAHPEELLPINHVDGNYFQTMRIPIMQGRGFGGEDAIGAPPAIILNERMARYYWPNENPVGRRLRFSSEAPWQTVVGVAADVKAMGLADAMGTMEIYYPSSQRKTTDEQATFVIRTAVAPASLMASLRQQVYALDRYQPIGDLETAEQLLSDSLVEPRFYLLLMALFAGSAIVLAAVGLYGVLAYLVAERTAEIGLRMALGAQARDVVRLILRQGLSLALLGTGIGMATAFGMTRWIKSLLFEVQATDPWTYAAMIVVLLGVAFLACWIPARRASRVDPMIALRCD